VAGWKIEVSAIAGVMGVAVMMASLIASAGGGAAVHPARATAPVFSRLSAIPSHNGLYRGDGRYRVEGLRVDRRRWWNVRLNVVAPGGADSLAFNLVR
jgi:hypothetical protein